MRANIQSRSPATASPGRLCMKPEIRGISGEFGDSAKLLELLRQLTYGPPGLRFYTNGVFRKEHTIIGDRHGICQMLYTSKISNLSNFTREKRVYRDIFGRKLRRRDVLLISFEQIVFFYYSNIDIISTV